MILNTCACIFLQAVQKYFHTFIAREHGKSANSWFVQHGAHTGELAAFPTAVQAFCPTASKIFAPLLARAAVIATTDAVAVLAADGAREDTECNYTL